MSTFSLPSVKDANLAPPAGIKLVVWDFDLTMLCIHAFGQRVKPAAVATRSMEDDFADYEFITALVPTLVDKHGVKVAIASFGSIRTIEAYMKRVLPDYFSADNISTPRSVGRSDGCSVAGGKVPQLELLCKQFGVEPHEVMFFDDDNRNIEGAAKVGYKAFYTASCFTRVEWLAALELFKAPAADEEPDASESGGGGGGGGGGTDSAK